MYNRRRAECETVVTFFQAKLGADAVQSLRDVSLADLEENWDSLDPVGRKPTATCWARTAHAPGDCRPTSQQP